MTDCRKKLLFCALILSFLSSGSDMTLPRQSNDRSLREYQLDPKDVRLENTIDAIANAANKQQWGEKEIMSVSYVLSHFFPDIIGAHTTGFIEKSIKIATISLQHSNKQQPITFSSPPHTQEEALPIPLIKCPKLLQPHCANLCQAECDNSNEPFICSEMGVNLGCLDSCSVTCKNIVINQKTRLTLWKKIQEEQARRARIHQKNMMNQYFLHQQRKQRMHPSLKILHDRKHINSRY